MAVKPASLRRGAAVFLDKDGTLVHDVPYNTDPARVVFYREAAPSLKRLQAAGYQLFVISNQSGVARGFFDETAARQSLGYIEERLQAMGVQIDGWLYCPHHPAGTIEAYRRICDCRKPQPGMLWKAAERYNLALEDSWMIGDILDDIEAGNRAGCRSILIDNGNETEWRPGPNRTPWRRVANLTEAADSILNKQKGGVMAIQDQMVDIAERFTGKRVLVLGEATTDIDLIGSSSRVAREAPVPIVQIDQVKRVPGRAANAAVNVAQLAGTATFLSVVGDDSDGEILRHILEEQHVVTDHVIIDPGRQTQTVQRVKVGDHLLLRFDHGTQDDLNKRIEARLIRRLRRLYPRHDAILISDYGYGILSDSVLKALADLQLTYHKPLVIDSKYLDKYKEVGATAVKPNYQEAMALLGITQAAAVGKRAAQLQSYQDKLLTVTGAEYALVTLDVEGSIVLGRNLEHPYRTYSRSVEHSKAVGAGDTYSAALTLSLAADASITTAAEIAQAAAMVVVQKAGTVTCSHHELLQFFSTDPKFIADRQELQAYVQDLKEREQRIIFTNGCFDILHSGHVSYLNQAKAQGDILIVGLNSDDSVRRLKGPERPVNTLEERVRVLSGLSAVDMVVPFEEDTPLNLIKIVQPDVYVKGGDYDRESLPETPLVEKLGGEVAIMPFRQNRSTTRLIARIRDVAEKVRGGGAPDASSRELGSVY